MMHVEHCGIKEERGKHGSLYERGSSNPQTPVPSPQLIAIRLGSSFQPLLSLYS